MSEILVVTGMSGAGRSTVSAALEDSGWSVIDNLPVELIPRVSVLAAGNSPDFHGVAFVIGRSGRINPEEVIGVTDEITALGFSAKIMFLDAPDEVLVRRFEGNRRRHPVAGNSVTDSITKERHSMQPLLDRADLVIDTGSLNTNQLRTRISELFQTEGGRGAMKVSVISFGYSNGIPRDVDLVFDCRFIPNPHWDEKLRPLTGLDTPVAEFVLKQEETQRFINDIVALLEWQIPAFAREGKSYLTIAIGCTGGKHRSVAIAEALQQRLHLQGEVFHRDTPR
ncbi:MAG: RNase adapter RapZ [Actinomycetota bacterium]